MHGVIETPLTEVLLAHTRDRAEAGWGHLLGPGLEGKETPDIPGVFVSPCPELSHQLRAGNTASLLCQPLKGISRGLEHNVAGTDPTQESLKQRWQKKKCFEDS